MSGVHILIYMLHYNIVIDGVHPTLMNLVIDGAYIFSIYMLHYNIVIDGVHPILIYMLHYNIVIDGVHPTLMNLE